MSSDEPEDEGQKPGAEGDGPEETALSEDRAMEATELVEEQGEQEPDHPCTAGYPCAVSHSVVLSTGHPCGAPVGG